MSFDFLLATDEEILGLRIENEKSLIDTLDLWLESNNLEMGSNDFQGVKDLANFFLLSEDSVPNEIINEFSLELDKKLITYKLYQFEKDFIERVAKFDEKKLDDLNAIEFWQSRGYFSPVIWCAMYGLHRLSKSAIRENKNIYLLEEINESNLEK